MRRRDLLRAAAVSPLAVGLSDRPRAAAEANAAGLYREAVAALPPRTPDDAAVLRAAMTTPLDEVARGLVGRSTRALDLMTRAASAPSCDWGDSWVNAGWYAAVELGMDASSLGQLSALGSRLDREAGRPSRGLPATLAAMVMGRRIAQGRIKMAQLIGFAIEHVAIEAVAALLIEVEGRDRAEVRERFGVLPAPVSLADMIRAEKAWFFGGHLPEHRGDFTGADLTRQKAGYDEWAAACETPAGLAKILAEEPADEDGRKSREGLNAFVRGRTYIEVKRALFLAAIAVSAGGPGAVAAVPDPTDGEPFALRSWASGFELTSRFTLDFKEGKPRASLIAGRK